MGDNDLLLSRAKLDGGLAFRCTAASAWQCASARKQQAGFHRNGIHKGESGTPSRIPVVG